MIDDILALQWQDNYWYLCDCNVPQEVFEENEEFTTHQDQLAQVLCCEDDHKCSSKNRHGRLRQREIVFIWVYMCLLDWKSLTRLSLWNLLDISFNSIFSRSYPMTGLTYLASLPCGDFMERISRLWKSLLNWCHYYLVKCIIFNNIF